MEVVFAFYVTYKDNYLFFIFILKCLFLTLFCFLLLFPSKRHRSRPPSDQIAFAARLGCVRGLIGLRTGDDDFCKRVTIVRTAFCTGKAHTSFCRLSV